LQYMLHAHHNIVVTIVFHVPCTSWLFHVQKEGSRTCLRLISLEIPAPQPPTTPPQHHKSGRKAKRKHNASAGNYSMLERYT
jgi:hypothetical protein